LALEHRLQFVRRSGEEDQYGARFLHPLARGGAAIVGQDVGAFDDEGLALVHFGHFALGLGEALFEPLGEVGTEYELAIERHGDGFARDVVLGGAEAAREDDDGGAGDGATDGVGEGFTVVADHRLGAHFHAQVIQLAGEPERVGVDALGRQHFRADSDDFGVHQKSGLPLMPTSTR
jgi:hypothetical protein